MAAPNPVGLCRDGNHVYWLDGEKIPRSVTGITGVLDKPGIKYWAAKTTAQYVVNNADVFGTFMKRGDNDAAIRWLSGEAMAYRDRKADLGSRVHKIAEALSLGQTVEMSDDERPYVTAYQKFLAEKQPKFRMLEAMVCNLTHRYAGAFDWMAEIEGVLTLGDNKTTTSVFGDVALQLAGYQFAEFIGYPGDPKRYRIPQASRYSVLHLKPDADYALVDFDVTPREFRCFLGLADAQDWNTTRSKKVILKELERAA